MPAIKLSIELTAKLTEFEANLRKTPGITEREIKKAVKAMKTQLMEAQKAGEAAAKASKKAWTDSYSGVEALVKRVGEKMGGSFALMSSSAVEGSKDIGKILGPLGQVGVVAAVATASVAAIGLAIGAGTVAAVSLANAAVEAEKRLIASGHAAEIPAEARESLATYNAATTELKTNIDLLTVAVGGELAPTLTRASTLLVLVTDDTSAWGRSIDNAWATTRDMIADQSILNRVVLAGVDAINRAIDAKSGDIKQTQDQIAATNAMVEAETKLAEAEEDRRRKSAAAADAAIKAREAELGVFVGPEKSDGGRDFAEEARAMAAASAAAAEVRTAMLAENERGLEAQKIHKQEVIDIKARTQAYVDLSTMMAETATASAQAATEIAAMLAPSIAALDAAGTAAELKAKMNEIRDGALALAGSIASSLSDVFGAMGAHVAEQIDDIQARTDRLAQDSMSAQEKIRQIRDDAYASERQQLSALDRAQIDNLNDQIAGNNEQIKSNNAMYEAKRKAALRAFNAEKVANIAAIAANAAVALITAFAQVGPIGEPFAAAAIATAAAASAGIVAAQKPPEFPMGALPSPDHTVDARITKREAVLTDRGVAAVGGAAGVAAANGGQGVGGVTQIYLGRQLVAEVVGAQTPSKPVDPRRGMSGPRRRR